MLKIPDVTALSDALSLADSHKLVWAAVCLTGVRAVFYSLCVCAVTLCRQLSGAAAG